MAIVLDNIRDAVLTTTALGAWIVGIYRFKKARELESAVQLDVALETLQTGGSTLVQVAVRIRNIGKGVDRVKLTDGSICHVRKVTARPGSLEIPWDSDSTQELIPPMNYLANWFDVDADPLIFEPNCAETFHVLFSTDYHGPIWVRAELIDTENYHYRGHCLFTVP
jgi:hypothetical protein